MKLIEVKNVRLAYDGVTILDNINFSVNRGDYFCIVGENGSGKSTLMRAILSLKPISGGEIIMNGIKSREIGYLPQRINSRRDFPASIYEVVISGCGGSTLFYRSEHKKKAAEAIERVGLTGMEKRCFSELSGGQAQRVLLARALCAAKSLILLDEPVAGLDPEATADMYNCIESLNRDGMTVIMISHDIASVLKYATNILHVGNNTSFACGKEEYLKFIEGKENEGER